MIERNYKIVIGVFIAYSLLLLILILVINYFHVATIHPALSLLGGAIWTIEGMFRKRKSTNRTEN